MGGSLKRASFAALGLALIGTGWFVAVPVMGGWALRGASYAWQPGIDYVYRFSYRMDGEASAGTFYLPSDGNSSMTPLHEVAEGVLRYTLVGRAKGGNYVTLVVTWESAQGLVEVTPFTLDVSHKGAIGAVTFAAASTPMERHRVRNLLSVFQFELPPQGGAAWAVREADLNGEWLAQYRVVGSRRGLVFCEKGTLGGSVDGGVELKRTGLVTATFDPRALRLAALQGQHEKSYRMGQWSVGHETAKFDLAFVGEERHDEARARALSEHVKMLNGHALASTLRGQDEAARNRVAALRQRVAGKPLAAVIARLSSNPNGTLAELLEPSRQLEAYLELEPGAAAQASLRELAALDPNSEAFASIATSLTSAGNEAAQNALQQAMTLRVADTRTVRRLIPHLGMVKRPTLQSEQFLRSIALEHDGKSLGDTAQLSLGIMGGHLRGAAPERADRLFEDARQALDGHRDDDLFLHVLGNIGHAKQVEVVRPLLKGNDADARALALSTLRFVETPDAQAVLMESAQGDPHGRVRMRAVEALGHHKQDDAALDLYLSQLQSEKSVIVLWETLRNLSTMVRSSSTARKAYEKFLQNCGHPELCPYARGLWSAAS